MDQSQIDRLKEYVRDHAQLATGEEALVMALTLTARIIDAQSKGQSLFIEEMGVFQDAVVLYRKKALSPQLIKLRDQPTLRQETENPESD